MELISLIPDTSDRWSVKSNFLMFKKYQNIPVCFIKDEIVYVFLEGKIPKEILKIVKHLVKLDIEFYFTSPEMSNPSGIYTEDFNNKTIKQYLITFSNKDFFYGFRKINFDIIDNLVKWTIKENCFSFIKENYDIVLKMVCQERYDGYTGTHYFECSEEIRDEFRGLYRDMIISSFL